MPTVDLNDDGPTAPMAVPPQLANPTPATTHTAANPGITPAIARQLAGLSFLAESGVALAASLDFRSTLTRVARIGVPTLGEYCVVDLLDEDGLLRRAETAHVDPDLADTVQALRDFAPPPGEVSNAVWRAIRTGQTQVQTEINVHDVPASDRGERFRELILRLGAGSSVTAPLIARGRTFGATSYISAVQHYFEAADVALIQDFAVRAALALDNARLYQEAQEQGRRAQIESEERRRVAESLRFLVDASSALAACVPDFERMLQGLADLVVPRFADWCTAELLDKDGLLRQVAIAHADPDRVQLAVAFRERHQLMPSAGDALDEAISIGRGILHEQVDLDRLARGGDPALIKFLRGLELRSSMTVPIMARGQVLGALVLLTAESGRSFDRADLRVAEELGRRSGLALDNARLYRDAQDAIRVRQDVLASVSHDLKNPLQAIKLAASAIAREAGTRGKTNRVLQAADSVQRAAGRMDRMIHDLLDAAAIEAGSFTLWPVEEDVEELLDEALEMLEPIAGRKSIALECRAAELLPRVSCDRQRVLQVFSNLIGNAIQFSAEGQTVTVQASRDGSNVRIAIADRGAGIAAEQLALIFEPYFTTRGRAGEGTGLGLYIARGIIEAHGGELWCHSEKGVGSTFYFTLPVILQ